MYLQNLCKQFQTDINKKNELIFKKIYFRKWGTLD